MNVLAIAAHPDDETLGCGGTLLGHRDTGDRLHWLIASVGTEPRWSADAIAAKAREVDSVAAAYGMTDVFRLGFPTTGLTAVPETELIESVRGVIERVQPEVVYLVNRGDVHTDHFAVASAAMAVLRPPAMTRLGVRRVLAFETLSSTDAAVPGYNAPFVPNVFNDITPHVEEKLHIMSLYQSEVQPDPAPRGPSAIRALARYRGANVGVEHAEAFMLLREINRA